MADGTGTIFLAYHIVQMVLYRAMLRHLDPTDVRYHLFRNNVKPVVDNVISLLQGLTVRRLRAFWWNRMYLLDDVNLYCFKGLVIIIPTNLIMCLIA